MLRLFGLLAIVSLISASGFATWRFHAQHQSTNQVLKPLADATPAQLEAAAIGSPKQALLQESWDAYRQRFIQPDGRVIDWEADGLSTSEGQAYAMLRAVMVDDPKTFDITLQWAEKNLLRQANGQPSDRLWAWKWGKNANGKWLILDSNFASDADIDAITALILASRRWQRPDYLNLARAKLKDLWTLSTVAVGNPNQRYLLPGPIEVFRQASTIQLNPSYLAPYAFRLFAQVDSSHDWLSLVESSYQVLEKSSTLSSVGLPSDWVDFNASTGQFVASAGSRSRYSFDAFRVWWRVSLDAAWFDAPQARRYLQQHLKPLQALWRSQNKIPARMDLKGQPLVNYEATSQYGMLYPAFRLIDPPIADQIYQQKLSPIYRSGLWENDSAYYTQNLVWLGLIPPGTSAFLLQPGHAAQATIYP